MLNNKIILWIFSLIFKPFKRDENIWVYAEEQNNSALPLLKYAQKTDNRKHVYISKYKIHNAELRDQGILAFTSSSLLGYYYITRAKITITSTANPLGRLSSKYFTNDRLIINIFHGIPIKNITIQNINKKGSR